MLVEFKTFCAYTHTYVKLHRAEVDLRDCTEKVDSAKQDLVTAVSEVRDTKEQKAELMQQKRDLDKAVRESKVGDSEGCPWLTWRSQMQHGRIAVTVDIAFFLSASSVPCSFVLFRARWTLSRER